jgi:hypothetical protein
MKTKTRRPSPRAAGLIAAAVVVTVVSVAAAGPHLSAWSAQKIDDTGGNSSELNTRSSTAVRFSRPTS